jgi:hypothetical protein
MLKTLKIYGGNYWATSNGVLFAAKYFTNQRASDVPRCGTLRRFAPFGGGCSAVFPRRTTGQNLSSTGEATELGPGFEFVSLCRRS